MRGAVEERERESRHAVREKVGGDVVEADICGAGEGGLEGRETVPVPGVLAREEVVSMRRTAGARWRRRVRME